MDLEPTFYLVRIAEMRKHRISPQKLALSGQAAELLKNTNASDNFRNLFEVPVLFYVVCTVLLVGGSDSLLLTVLAWLFVALRYLHSLIHLTHNTVMQRFKVYVAGTLVVYTMWIVTALKFFDIA